MSELAPPAQRYLLIGDETALPAIARFAEELTPGLEAQAVVEIADEAERQDLPIPVTWVHREGGEDLLTTLRAMEFPTEGTVAWVAGEAGAVRRVRMHLRRDRGLDTVHATGYWRRGAAGDQPDEPPTRIRAMTDSLTPMAIRLGVTLGIPTS